MDLLGRERSVRIGGLHGASLGLVLAAVAQTDTALLVVTADARTRDALRLDLTSFLGRDVLPFPAWPRSEHTAAPDADVLLARTTVLEALADARRGEGAAPVVVASLEALVQEYCVPESGRSLTINLKAMHQALKWKLESTSVKEDDSTEVKERKDLFI